MAKDQTRLKKSSVRSAALQLDVPAVVKTHSHGIFIGVIALLLVIFFNEAIFSGKVFNVPDSLSALVYEQGYLAKARQDGVNAFWNPYIFCGMPTWGSAIPGHGMYLHTFLDPFQPMVVMQVYAVVQSVVNALGAPMLFWDIFNYFLLGIFTYFFGIRRKFEPWVACVVAVSVVFSLYSLNWIMAGHNTKITVFAWLPAILLLIDKLFEKRSLLTVALLTVAFHFTFNSGHVQMIFYSLIMVLLYVLFKFYEGASFKTFALVSVATLIAAGFAFLMLSGPYFATWEYKDFSIRGAGSGGSGHGPATGGLDYAYATNWSFSPMEILTFVIPSFAGWGTPTYWGTMPFTESPVYLGVVACFLAVIGIVLRPKDRFVHYLVFASVLFLLISLGRNFGLVYDLMFKYIPFFSTFRIPSMILFMNALTVGMLAGVGLTEIIRRLRTLGTSEGQRNVKSLNKALGWTLGVAVVFLLGLLVSKGSMTQAIETNMKAYQPRYWEIVQQVEQAYSAGQGSRIASEYPEYKNATRDGIYGMAVNDALFSAAAVLVVCLLIFGLQRRKINFSMFMILLLVAVIIDWWRVDYKPMKLEPKRAQQQQLAKTDVVNFLQQDKDTYRILPATQHSGDNWYVAFDIQSVSGYNPAKMKYYDDIRNKLFGEFQFMSADQLDRANWPLLNMLNTKYVVVPKGFDQRAPWLRRVYSGSDEAIYQNDAVLPRAFFVNRVEVIKDDSLMFQALTKNYHPESIAYLSEPLQTQLPAPADSGLAQGTAKLTQFSINEFSYEVETPQDAVLKLSETYYPSGWSATLDGQPISILRSDYALRAVLVPKGKHVLRMWFEPRSYKTGLAITVATNYTLLLVLLFYLVMWSVKTKPWQRKKSEPREA